MPIRISSPRVPSAITILCVALFGLAGCRQSAEPSPSAQAPLETMVQVASAGNVSRLVAGFHERDNAQWRWTMREFSIILTRPRGAAERGATLVLEFAIPEANLAVLKSVNLSATVGGFALPSQAFDRPGSSTYRQQVPAAAFGTGALRVDFALDKAVHGGPGDDRELGVVVTAAGFVAE